MRALIDDDAVPSTSSFDSFKGVVVPDHLGCAWAELSSAAIFTPFSLDASSIDAGCPAAEASSELPALIVVVIVLTRMRQHAAIFIGNHIGNQDAKNLESTLGVLERNGLLHAEAGRNSRHTSKLIVVAYCEKAKVAVFACADKKLGAEFLYLIESLDAVRCMKGGCGFSFVLRYKMLEYRKRIVSRWQRVYHRLSNVRADSMACRRDCRIVCAGEPDSSSMVYGRRDYLFCLSECLYWLADLLVVAGADATTVEARYVPLRKRVSKTALTRGDSGDSLPNRPKMKLEAIALGRMSSGWFMGRPARLQRFASKIDFAERESHRKLLLAGSEGPTRLGERIGGADALR